MLSNLLNFAQFCSRQEIMDFVGLKDKKNFVKNYFNPMIEQGMIEITNPDKPTSKFQKYVAKKG
jgi:ATP-dependent DNA helicase RecG